MNYKKREKKRMLEIPLSRGLVSLVDDDIYDFLMQWSMGNSLV